MDVGIDIVFLENGKQKKGARGMHATNRRCEYSLCKCSSKQAVAYFDISFSSQRNSFVVVFGAEFLLHTYASKSNAYQSRLTSPVDLYYIIPCHDDLCNEPSVIDEIPGIDERMNKTLFWTCGMWIVHCGFAIRLHYHFPFYRRYSLQRKFRQSISDLTAQTTV